MDFNNIFFRPPPSTYTKKDFSGTDRFFEVPTQNTSNKRPMNIPCAMLPFMVGKEMISKYYIVYFHGNAEDLGTSYDFLFDLRQSVRCNIILTEYPGYGIYRDATPTCQQIEYDAKQIIEYLIKTLEIPKQHIILLGRSMGSGPACILASKYKVRGLMLISAFTSLKEVAKNMVGQVLCGIVSDRFRNIECMDSIQCPVLFIHGKKDPLVPIHHSEMLSDKLQYEVSECFQEDMTHNDYDTDADIMNNIATFLKDKMSIFQRTNDPLFSKFESFRQKKFCAVYPEALTSSTEQINQTRTNNIAYHQTRLQNQVEFPSLITEEIQQVTYTYGNNEAVAQNPGISRQFVSIDPEERTLIELVDRENPEAVTLQKSPQQKQKVEIVSRPSIDVPNNAEQLNERN